MKKFSRKTRIMTAFAVAFLVGLAFQSVSVCVEAQYYQLYTLTVTMSEAGAGTVSPTFGKYGYGETVRVTVETNAGFLFDGWYLNGEYQGKLSTIYVTIYGDSVLNAVFSKREAKLTITVNPEVGGNTAPLPQVWYYDYGISVQVKAYSNAGYVFDGWYLDGLYKGLDVNLGVLMTKDHQLDAYFATPDAVQPKPNDTRVPSFLALSCKSSASLAHFYAQIEGYLMGGNDSGGVVLPNIPVFFSYSVTGGRDWIPLTSVNTNDRGIFSVTWMPAVTGNYMIQAVWDGDETYTNATTVVNFAVESFQAETVFSVTSNSTLSQLSFNSNSSELSFSVTGASGTTGYVNLYVPKSLITDVSDLKVYLDQTQLTYTYLDSGDSWLVLFNYEHSTHAVKVDFAGKAAGADNLWGGFLPLGLAVVAVVVVAIALVLLVRRKKSKAV